MIEEKTVFENLKKLRETTKKRNFDQTLDLIINLKNFDLKRDGFNIFIELPNKIKDKKIAGFFEKDLKYVDTIKKDDFVKYKEKKDIKKLVKKYDFFIADIKLMPLVATTFGRILGPLGKMPSPQLGIIKNDEEDIKEIIKKINHSVRIRTKEPSIKVGVGKESMKDEEIVKNILSVLNAIIEKLPKKKENIKNVQIKFSMGKPITIK